MVIEPSDLARIENRRPAWELALIYPDQGSWTEGEYLDLDIGRLVEFSDGYLEFQPQPDELHQAIVLFLVNALRSYGGGNAIMAPFPVQLWPSKFREPDVAFMKEAHASRRKRQFWEGADLVIEVISESNRKLDVEIKRQEYARAEIPEYWLVDPAEGRITVLSLLEGQYAEHGSFARDQRATSALLPGFVVDVNSALRG